MAQMAPAYGGDDDEEEEGEPNIVVPGLNAPGMQIENQGRAMIEEIESEHKDAE
jgi:hypothetical protein